MFYSSIYDSNFSEYFYSTNVVKIIFLARAVGLKNRFCHQGAELRNFGSDLPTLDPAPR